jgi:hypothetical protein
VTIIVPDLLYPWGPYGGTFWGGFWDAPPGVGAGVSDALNSVEISATPIGYSTARIQWEEPGFDHDYSILARSSYGYPITPTEGTPVLSFPEGTLTSQSFEDHPLQGGRFYYYSLFVRSLTATPQWVRVGQCAVLIPQNNDAGGWLMGLLPSWYSMMDEQTSGHPTNDDMAEWGHLRRYLEIIGQQVDGLRTETDTLLDAYDSRLTFADLLYYMSQTFGFPYEPHIGYAQVRRLMANWFEILKTKATLPGVELFIESVTGYEAAVSIGKNLVPLRADSDFAGGSVGQWAPFAVLGDTVDSIEVDDTVAAFSADTVAALKITALGTGTWTLANATLDFLDIARSVRRTAQPVEPDTEYTMSLAFRAETTQRNCSITIAFYDRDGVATGSATTTNAVNGSAVGVWTSHEVTATSPSDARFLVTTIGVSSPAAGEVHWITAYQIEAAGAATSFEPARRINIQMAPTRVNWFPNPSFESASPLYFNDISPDWSVAHETAESLIGADSLAVTIASGRTSTNIQAKVFGDIAADAELILFDVDVGPNYEVFILYTATMEAVQITDNAARDNWWPKLNPADGRVYYCSTPAGVHDTAPTAFEQMTIRSCRLDGTDDQEVLGLPATLDASWTQYGHPEFNFDGSRMVIFIKTAVAYAIVEYETTGWTSVNIAQLYIGGDACVDPSYSPDGAYIVYAEAVSGSPRISRVDADAGINANYTVLIAGGVIAWWDPYYSPDGTKVLALATTANPTGPKPGGVWGNYYCLADGTGFAAIHNDGNIDGKATWARNGEQIYNHRLTYPLTAGFRLHRIDLDGTDLTTLEFEGDPIDGEYPSLVGGNAQVEAPAPTLGDNWLFAVWVKAGQALVGETASVGFTLYTSGGQYESGACSPVTLATGWNYLVCEMQISQEDIDNGVYGFAPTVMIEDHDNTGPVYYLEAVLLERNGLPERTSYFDGSTDETSLDYLWESTPHDSPSMYYPNRWIRDARLRALLPDFIPPLSPFNIEYTLVDNATEI